jgi:hypothetical protein
LPTARALDVAAHENDQILGDGQSQPRSAIFPAGRAIGLSEPLKKRGDLTLRNADSGIYNPKLQGDINGRSPFVLHPHDYVSFMSELEGVS